MPFCPGVRRSLQSPPFFSHSSSYASATTAISGLLSTAKSPVFLAKSVTILIDSMLGFLMARNGSSVVSTRERASTSLISETTAATVQSCSDFASKVEIEGSFFKIGPASRMIVCTGLWDDMAAPTTRGMKIPPTKAHLQRRGGLALVYQ